MMMGVETRSGASAVPAARRREPLGRRLLWLILATAALVAFILMLGDSRRRSVALVRAAEYITQLQSRLGPGRSLPLNLAFEPDVLAISKPLRFTWLSREEAEFLRQDSNTVLVAQTAPIRCHLRRNGRAVILFEKGDFRAEWVTLPEFDRLLAAQQVRLRSANSSAAP